MHKNLTYMIQGVRRVRSTAVLALLLVPVAHADNPPPADTTPVDSDAIQEIVVTAQKRSESLQSVPVSVTALTSKQLADLKLDSPSDLVTQVPNLQVNGIVGRDRAVLASRRVDVRLQPQSIKPGGELHRRSL